MSHTFNLAAAQRHRQTVIDDLRALDPDGLASTANGNLFYMVADAITLRGLRVRDMRVGELLALIEEATRHFQLQQHAWNFPLTREVARDALHH